MYKEELSNIIQSLEDLNFVKKILGILRKIILNILKNPKNPKFRLLKRGNSKLEEYIFQVPSVCNFLFILGFVMMEDNKMKPFLVGTGVEPAQENFYMDVSNVNIGLLEFILDLIREFEESVLWQIKSNLPDQKTNKNLIPKKNIIRSKFYFRLIINIDCIEV